MSESLSKWQNAGPQISWKYNYDVNASSCIYSKKKKKEQNWGENFHFILRMCVCCVTQKPSMWHKLEEKKVCLYVLFNKFLPLFFSLMGCCPPSSYQLGILLAILQTHILVINIFLLFHPSFSSSCCCLSSFRSNFFNNNFLSFTWWC